MKRRPRIVLADEQSMVCDMLARILQPEFEIVHKVCDGPSLIEAAKLAPDAVVLDVTLPGTGAVEAIRGVREVSPKTKLVVLTMANDEILAKAVMDAGASGYLLKTAALDDLAAAIRAALLGQTFVTPEVARKLENVEPQARRAGLTEREHQVLALLVEGKPMREVAAILNLTPRTIAFHKYRIMKKLRVRSSAELIRIAILRTAWGL